jgi:hypothetical protein
MRTLGICRNDDAAALERGMRERGARADAGVYVETRVSRGSWDQTWHPRHVSALLARALDAAGVRGTGRADWAGQEHSGAPMS